MWFVSVSWINIVCLSLKLQQIIDLLAMGGLFLTLVYTSFTILCQINGDNNDDNNNDNNDDDGDDHDDD